MTYNFTEKQLGALLPGNKHVAQWYTALAEVLPQYEINTKLRLAAFLAQTAHESANYTQIKENLFYRAESLLKVFPKYFPTLAVAQQYANKPEAIANKVYANRMGNGSEASGDGFRYCGRGLIQLTGKQNYELCAASIKMPLPEFVEYVQTFDGAVHSACWFWKTNKLNQWADKGDITSLTKRINGGTIGLADRKKHYEHALHILGD